jgi:ribonuclease-3
MNLEKLCNIISYNFKDLEILKEALTHPSLSKELKNNYQRLEFLGDKILSFTISNFLFHKYKNENEGDLSKRNALLVSGETLAEIALEIGLDKFLLLSEGEKKLGGNVNKRNLENSLEALIGAIYIDGNLQEAQNFILNFWDKFLSENKNVPKDPISNLQEIIQEKTKNLPIYEIRKIGGLDHEPEFLAKLFIEELNINFEAKGNSKKEAQKEVAKLALIKLQD